MSNESTATYAAFGLVICSEVILPQVPPAPADAPIDVRVVRADLSDLDSMPEGGIYQDNLIAFEATGVGRFRITDGSLIEVMPLCAEELHHLAVYVLGSCMGAVIHQRGMFPIHGSCVTNGVRSVLITGDSGAGKSTLAAEFLSRGWRLLTDDVAVICDPLGEEGGPIVQPSYPSQKLWADSMERYGVDDDQVHSLYARNGREKYGIDVATSFCVQPAPLTLIIRLAAVEDFPTTVQPVEGFAKVDQLVNNTYRAYMIAPENRQQHFQRCVTMGTHIPMALAVRNKSEQTAALLCDRIIEYMEAL